MAVACRSVMNRCQVKGDAADHRVCVRTLWHDDISDGVTAADWRLETATWSSSHATPSPLSIRVHCRLHCKAGLQRQAVAMATMQRTLSIGRAVMAVACGTDYRTLCSWCAEQIGLLLINRLYKQYYSPPSLILTYVLLDVISDSLCHVLVCVRLR